MERLVPFLIASGVVLGVAGIALVVSGQTLIGGVLLLVGLADAAVALVVRLRAGH